VADGGGRRIGGERAPLARQRRAISGSNSGWRGRLRSRERRQGSPRPSGGSLGVEVDTGRTGTQERNGHETGGGAGFASASRRWQGAASFACCTVLIPAGCGLIRLAKQAARA